MRYILLLHCHLVPHVITISYLFFFPYSYLSAPLEYILYERGVLFVLFTALCLVPKSVCGTSQLLIRLCFPLGLRFDFAPLTSS